jgi:SAM-dependent methyltransferase
MPQSTVAKSEAKLREVSLDYGVDAPEITRMFFLIAQDRLAACQEIARVLKPGGVAYIADYYATRSYAEAFRAQGLTVTGPINAIPIAMSLMFLVEARKPSA